MALSVLHVCQLYFLIFYRKEHGASAVIRGFRGRTWGPAASATIHTKPCNECQVYSIFVCFNSHQETDRHLAGDPIWRWMTCRALYMRLIYSIDLFINLTIWASFNTNFECRRVASSARRSRHPLRMSPELGSVNVHNWTKHNLLFSE